VAGISAMKWCLLVENLVEQPPPAGGRKLWFKVADVSSPCLARFM